MILARRVLIIRDMCIISTKVLGKGYKIIFCQRQVKKITLQCNFDTRKLHIYLPVFYKECHDAWATLNEVPVLSYEDVVNQIIQNNKNIAIGKASILDHKKVMRKGIVTIGDLLSDTGVFF